MKRFAPLASLFAFALVAAACGDGGNGTASPAPTDGGETSAPATDETTEPAATETTEPAATETSAPPVEVECTAAEAGLDTYKIAFQGDLSGENSALGQNMINGVTVAVNELNASGELDFTLEVMPLDSQGDPAQAPPLAQQAVQDTSVLAVVGPGFSGESAASGPIYDGGCLPFMTPSATNPDLANNGWEYFFRTVATDAAQGPAAATFISDNLGATEVCVIDDASEYGKGLADLVREELGDAVVFDEGVEPGGDFSTVVGGVVQSGCTAMFYGGYYSDAAQLRSQIFDQGGQDITFVSGDGTFDQQFIDLAGADKAEGSRVTYPGALPTDVEESFATAYGEASGGAAPGAYSLEAYQNTLLFGEALKTAGADRTAIRDFLDEFSGEIGGKQIEFDDNGDIAAQSYFVFKVEGGAWVQEATVG